MQYKDYPPCANCRYLEEYPVCPAFPQGIPNEILSGENGHTEQHPDQVGSFVFKPVHLKVVRVWCKKIFGRVK